jgi:hypothetical protein
MIYKAIKYILENDSAFAAAIGTDSDGDIKIYPIHPRKEVALPFCVFNIIDQRGNPTKDEASALDEVRVRVTILHTDLDKMVSISDKARTALDNEKGGGTYNGEVIASLDFESLNDGFNEAYGDLGALYIEHDYSIWSEP